MPSALPGMRGGPSVAVLCCVAPEPWGVRKEAAVLFPCRNLSVSINRPPEVVYAFVANARNLPRWARGLGTSVRRGDDGWMVETPQGPVTVRFVARNRLGVLDHYVTTPTGEEVYVPMRVLRNGTGSEVIFTLFRGLSMSEEQAAQDAALVEEDLRRLKAVLEGAT